MTVVTISSRYQIVIPKDVRERLNLKPGQQVDAVPFRGRVELIPVEPVESMRGTLRGIDTTVPREDDRL
ncbi:MAG: AbrB/MazE/SpoVT family DNA-binding domain-containing protein [Gemmatimonadota bacterium]|nr:AbrB/MazE/SpoVT family DNA-binding domain-containing protein [Gemmatimonadota bacterium]